MNSNRFGIWYLLRNICLFNNFEFSANLIDPSLLAVITIGEMKQSSEHLDSFSMCPSLSSWSIHNLILGRRWIGMLFPFRLYWFVKISIDYKILWSTGSFYEVWKMFWYVYFKLTLRWCPLILVLFAVRCKSSLIDVSPDGWSFLKFLWLWPVGWRLCLEYYYSQIR